MKIVCLKARFGMKALIFWSGIVWLCGCTTEYNLATRQEETLMLGTEKEISLGDAIARQVENNFEINSDIDVNERTEGILLRLKEVCDRKELVYTVKVIEDEMINAVSLPGGYIYVFKGLLDKIKDDNQLAGVIAHEMGHITAKHAVKRLQSSYGYMALQALAISSGSSDLAQGTAAIYTTMFYAFSQKDEFQADQLAVKYTQKAGYNPSAMIDVLKLLQEQERKVPYRPVSYFRTHPYINERIASLNKEINGQLGFKDYLNLTGER
jgi:predicted Zn-dependent protease